MADPVGGASGPKRGGRSRLPSPAASTIEARLALYQQYAAVMAEQEQALEERDLERFSELNATRQSIEAEVEAVPMEVVHNPDEETIRVIHRAVEMLESVEERQKRLRVRLKALRSELAIEVENLNEHRGSVRSYLKEDALGAVDQRPRIDVRS